MAEGRGWQGRKKGEAQGNTGHLMEAVSLCPHLVILEHGPMAMVGSRDRRGGPGQVGGIPWLLL
jgi:hypothetical protein